MLFTRNRVVLATVHVVGSENDLAPWSQLPGGDRPDLRLAEFEARRAAALDWIDTAFATADRTHAPGVLLLMQAEPTGTPGFAEIRQRIAERSRSYGKSVLLVHGDEHIYKLEPADAGVPNLDPPGDLRRHRYAVVAGHRQPTHRTSSRGRRRRRRPSDRTFTRSRAFVARWKHPAEPRAGNRAGVTDDVTLPTSSALTGHHRAFSGSGW